MENTTLNMTLLLRRAAFADDCVLDLGEPGYHTGTKELKVGDGTTAWKNLPFANQAQIEALIAAGVKEAKDYVDNELKGYKKLQDKVNSPVADGGSTLEFIDTVSQNEQGVITATKKAVDLSDYAKKSELPTELGVMSVSGSDAIVAEGSTDVTVALKLDDSGNVQLSQSENGLKADIDLSAYATKAEMSTAMVFKGTLGEGGTISTLPTASADTEGDTYKVITAGTYAGITAKVGDVFVSTASAWVLIPAGDEPLGTVTNVATGEGLTGGPITSSGTISHAVPTGSAAGDHKGSGERVYITNVKTDKFGHVTGVDTAAETETDTTYTVQPTENPLEFKVTPSKGDAQTVKLVAPTVDVGVEKIIAGTDIVVTPAEGTGEVTVSHKDYSTGTLTKDPTNLTKTGDAYFFNSLELSNGHVTSGSMKSLAETLAGMTFILDGGTSAN